MRDSFGKWIARGAAVIVLASFALFIYRQLKEDESYCLTEFNDLLKKQKTVDILDTSVIRDYAGMNYKKYRKDLSFLVVKPVPELLDKFMLKGFPEDMDTKHNLLLLALDDKSGEPLNIQMISFEALSDKMKEMLFKNADYTVIKGNSTWIHR